MPIELTKKGIDSSFLGSERFKKRVTLNLNMLQKNHFSHNFYKKNILKFWDINQ